jgi:hypothetical protein
MFRKFRERLSYANVMATIAMFLALGGGAYAAAIAPTNSVVSRSIKNGQVKRQDLARSAVSNTRIGRNAVSNSKIGPNAITESKIHDASVSSNKIADGSVTTPKLADNAVTSPKLAANSVSGLTQITDGTVTGADVLEDTLHFGCANTTVSALGNAGPYVVGTNGFCAFVLHPSGTRTWTQATGDCTGVVADSTLANPAQIEELGSTNGGSQSPVAGTTGIWTPDPAAANSIWTVQVGNDGHINLFTATPMGNASSGPEVCVYQPASKNG